MSTHNPQSVLFAQETLSPDALRAVAAACHARDADESKT